MSSTDKDSNSTTKNTSDDDVIQSEVNDDVKIENEDEPEVIEKHKNNDDKDDKDDSPSDSSQSNEIVEEQSLHEKGNLQTKPTNTSTTNSTTNQESSLIDYFRNLFISSLQASSRFLLSWIGVPLGQRQVSYSKDLKSQTKRKREDLKGSGDDGPDDSAEDEEEDSPGLNGKRWRPDIVLQAVERFITNFWGEKDSNENIKDNENDENMNSFISSGGTEGTWNKRPDINFFSDSVVADINDVNDKGIKGTSTPQIFLEGEAAGNIFVFSAEKSEKDASGISLGHDATTEERSLSHLTFEEKQAYFAEQIKVQEEAAAKSKPLGHVDEKSNCLTVNGKEES